MFPIPWNFPFRKKDGTVTNIDDAMSGGGGEPYTLPTASASVKGGIKIGAGLAMDGEVLNNTNPTAYSLPTASDEVKGGIKVGSGLSIDENGVLSTSGGGGGTQIYYKDYSNITFRNDGWRTIVENTLYCGNSNTNINISGYIPIAVTITDKNTGYNPNGNVFKVGTSGDNYEICLYATKTSPSSSFNARVYYVVSAGITEITT